MNSRGLRVDPQLVFGISILAALAISWPGLMGAMHGSADIMTVGIRFLIAVAVVWTALFCVASLIASYASGVGAAQDGAPQDEPRTATNLGGPAGMPATLELDAAQAAAAAAIAAETESAAG